MRTIFLHGRLRKQFGSKFRFAVSTAGEAIRFLSQLPGFIDALRSGSYHVVNSTGKLDTGLALDEEGINGFKLGKGDLHIVPYVAGSKRGGVLKAILGVVLVGAALFFSGGALSAPLLGGIGTYGNVAAIGAALALQGITTLMTPKKKDEKKQDDSSYMNAGPSNTYEQGSPVPLNYGDGPIGAVLISGSADIIRL